MISTLQAEFSQNTRLRLGVWLIALIVILYLALLQGDRLDISYKNFAQENQRLLKAEQILSQDDWLAQFESQSQVSTMLSNRLWHAETLGLAQAKLQGTLGDMIKTLGLRNTRMRSGTAQNLENVSGVWQVQVQLDAMYDRGDELQLLYRLAQIKKLLVVERLDLQANSGRLSLIVSGYFSGLEEQDL